jgi:hypothetical protein
VPVDTVSRICPSHRLDISRLSGVINFGINLVKHSGGCHCGEVMFEVEAPAEIEAYECNCSICSKSGFLHLIVPKSRFNLIQGSESLSTYTFNTGIAKHLFCKMCGVKSFYIPRSHPDGYSVNVRCLEPATIRKIVVIPFDGKNWEEHAIDLGPLSGQS